MLYLKEKNDILVRLHLLIKRKATGSPDELSSRLNVSRATLYRYIDTLRAYDAPVVYCKQRRCFYYDREFQLNFF